MVKRIPRDRIEHLIWKPGMDEPVREEVVEAPVFGGLDADNWKDDKGEPFYITQKKWIPKYNEAGRVMACASDYYHAAQNGDGAISSVQEDFKSWVMSSTRIIYNKESRDAEIVDYIGSIVVPEEKREINIPDYSNGCIVNDVLDTEEGRRFFQTLYRTEDDKEDILKTLKLLGGRDGMKVWTPSQESRKSNPERAVSFDYCDDYFHLSCSNLLYSNGRSRGVRASEASASRVGGVKGGGGA